MDTDRYAARIERMQGLLAGDGLDALVVTHLVNVRYLCGFTGSNATLLVPADGGPVLATDGRYTEQAAGEAPAVAVEVTREDGWLAGHLPPGSTVGLEAHAVSWERLTGLEQVLDGRELVRSERPVEQLRSRKDPDELTALARACAITAQVVEAVPAWLAPGLTEREVARRIQDGFLEAGADDRAFEPIVASGPNAARPHHRPTGRLLERGDLLQLDVGALVDGYHADMSRVFGLGAVTDDLAAIHRVVVEAQAAGVAAAGDGVAAGAVDAACRDVITEAGYGERFVHSSGHGIGLEIHERPILRDGSAARLRSHMAVTVEPGIYVPGAGGVRIEDVVVVTAAGADVLTPAPTDLLVV